MYQFPTLSRSPLAPLKFDVTFSLGSTNNNPYQSNTNLITAANPCQTFYQPLVHLICRRASRKFISSSSTVKPLDASSINTQNYNVLFAAMNKPVKTL